MFRRPAVLHPLRAAAAAALVAVALAPTPPTRAQGASTEPTVIDALGGAAPGREANEGLRRSLATPSAESRWRGLAAFGRDLFRASERLGAVEDAPVGPDYVLGPGDNLVVFVSGASDASWPLTLDREGKVFLPRVGSTFLWGLSFADAEALVRARLATVYRDARVQVSMGRVRAIEVFVLGAVAGPGKTTLTGMATAFHALAAAGGPGPLGSLRDIRVLRDRQEVARLDLYPFLLEGDRSQDVRLQSGDVVFVGLARARVGVQGAVTRPGVYEHDGPLPLSRLLAYAGGPTAFADLSRVRIERVDANGGFRLQDLPLDHGHGIDPDSLLLSAWDLVTVLPLRERLRDVVTLDGFVRHPGEYELTPGLRLSQLLAPERLLPEAALDEAELRRVDPVTFAVEVRRFSVRRAWAGGDDLPLRPLDAVTLYSAARFPRTVLLDGEVARPGTYTVRPGERLSELLQRAGGVTPAGALRATVFLRRSVARQQALYDREFAQRQRLDLARQQVRLAQGGDSAAVAVLMRAQADLAVALEGHDAPGRLVLRLDPAGRWRGGPDDPVLEDGDRITVPLEPSAVTVLGSVMNPGSLMARGRRSVDDYTRLAGGLTRQADAARAYVLRANGEAVPRAAARWVEPGDAVVVPAREVSGGSVARSAGGAARFLFELATAAALVVAVSR
jgi:protein involved in polysaccharide export with SLBB domain